MILAGIETLLCMLVIYVIYFIYSKVNPQLHDLPVSIALNTANSVKHREKHYTIDNSLPVSTLQYLETLSKDHTKGTTDLSGFPGKKINFKLTQQQEKQFLQQLISMDPIFKNYTIYKLSLGMRDRSFVVQHDMDLNKRIHTDFSNDALGVMTYINTVGGGTNTFTESNGEYKIVQRFHNKKNRTIVFPVNELHAGMYDLNKWPESVPYRLTLNMFLIKKHKTKIDRVVWTMQECELNLVRLVFSVVTLPTRFDSSNALFFLFNN